VQAKMKKGRSFMREEDRLEIVKSIKHVDSAFISIDENATVCKSLKRVRKMYPHNELVFANGGDRKDYEVPEAQACEKLDIEMVDGLGDKIRSSSKYTGLK
jgi:D-beta-D-heptose 7-phosphate kinase/D-beta-D-heptose 1-phosphate adenosyltransferase